MLDTYRTHITNLGASIILITYDIDLGNASVSRPNPCKGYQCLKYILSLSVVLHP